MKAIEIASDECLESVDQMSIEVQNFPQDQRSSYNSKIRQYKSQASECKEELKRLLDDEDRKALFGDNYNDSNTGGGLTTDQRRQLLQNSSALDRTSERLKDSQRIALDTENVGGNILNDLRSQREQISGSRNTLMAADTYVDRSVRTLKSMSRRLVANKFITYAIIAVLIILIFLVLISKFT